MSKHDLKESRARLCEQIAQDFLQHVSRFDGIVESPIERVLLEHMIHRTQFRVLATCELFPDWCFCASWDESLEVHFVGEAAVIPQCKIGKYRADFAVFCLADIGDNKYAKKTFVVECDGHNYHERTKEQAARDRKRDREMVADGITVLRFTGSEIWKDPAACADEIINVVIEWYGSTVRVDW